MLITKKKKKRERERERDEYFAEGHCAGVFNGTKDQLHKPLQRRVCTRHM
jgi:hypothetical protein